MKKRTCPYCNYQYSFNDYAGKLLFKLIWDEWNCKQCSNLITFNAKRRLFLALVFGIWVAVTLIVKDKLNETPFLWILIATLFIIGSVFIFAFDTFDKVRKEYPNRDNM